LRIKFSSALSRSEEIVFSGLLAIASAIFLLDLLSLYSTPVPDSYLWWGDESWLMLEFRNQMMHGVFLHPYALGSSLAHGSGIIFGNMWVTAIFYGIPAAFITPAQMDIVLLGRSITTIFSFTLLVALYEIVRRLTLDRLLALFSMLLLLTSRSFLFTSHSARYDILTALAILLGIYYLLRIHLPLTILRAAFMGCIAATTMLVTIHVTLALMLATLVAILYHAGNRWPSLVLGFLGGIVTFVIMLLAISALRGQLTLFGMSGTDSFALNLHDIPALRFFSRSVQIANLSQRWTMLRMYGSGYAFVFAGLAVATLVQYLPKLSRTPIRIHAITVVVVLFSWLEFESAAPSSYLIYVLPVLSIAAALWMKDLVQEHVRIWVIAVLSIIVGFFAFRDIPGMHGKGYHLMTANALAVGTALGEMESSDTGIHPLVLAFNPAVHEVLRDTNVRLMTTQFIEYPADVSSGRNFYSDSILRKVGVNYVLFYSSSIKPDYMREVGPIRSTLDRIGTPVWERPGYFTDIGRTYFGTTLGAPDTLRLYRINKAK
jgi:hypothetical protein